MRVLSGPVACMNTTHWPGRLLLWLAGFFALSLTGCGAAITPTPPPTLEPIAQVGQPVFQQTCAICHSTTPDLVIRGPSLLGVAERAAGRVSGMDARSYLYTSILNPTAFTVEGFQNLMPTDFGKTLTGEQLDAVVAYLLTLRP